MTDIYTDIVWTPKCLPMKFYADNYPQEHLKIQVDESRLQFSEVYLRYQYIKAKNHMQQIIDSKPYTFSQHVRARIAIFLIKHGIV